jgi:hypothetical protein
LGFGTIWALFTLHLSIIFSSHYKNWQNDSPTAGLRGAFDIDDGLNGVDYPSNAIIYFTT